MMRATATTLAMLSAIAGASVAVASMAALVAERSAPPRPSPDVLSIRMMHEDEAHDMWHEALSLGESVCLTELNDGGLRYWLHSCPSPRFENGSN